MTSCFPQRFVREEEDHQMKQSNKQGQKISLEEKDLKLRIESAWPSIGRVFLELGSQLMAKKAEKMQKLMAMKEILNKVWRKKTKTKWQPIYLTLTSTNLWGKKKRKKKRLPQAWTESVPVFLCDFISSILYMYDTNFEKFRASFRLSR